MELRPHGLAQFGAFALEARLVGLDERVDLRFRDDREESVDDPELLVSNVAVTVAFTSIWDVVCSTGDVAVTPDTVTVGTAAGGAAVILVGATSASPAARATTTTTLKCCIKFS